MSFEQEPLVRLACFAGVLLAMAVWELLAPRRPRLVRRFVRWSSHLGLVGVNNLLVRLVLPVTAIETALLAEANGWGLLHRVHWPAWWEGLLAVVALDFVIYLQHVLFHAVPLLWRLHRVHHVDLDLDATTGVRFHTFEILVSMLIKCGAVLVIGASPWAVLAFEVLLNATSLFNHGNVALPLGIDRWLRLIVVTPDMHRVHHSVIPRETNSNFGFNLPWWDRILGTYRAQPAAGHDGMTIGQSDLRDESRTSRLHWLLILPFLRIPAADPKPDWPSA